MVSVHQAIHGPTQLALAHFFLNLILRLSIPAVPTLNLKTVDPPLKLEEAQFSPEGTWNPETSCERLSV